MFIFLSLLNHGRTWRGPLPGLPQHNSTPPPKGPLTAREHQQDHKAWGRESRVRPLQVTAALPPHPPARNQGLMASCLLPFLALLPLPPLVYPSPQRVQTPLCSGSVGSWARPPAPTAQTCGQSPDLCEPPSGPCWTQWRGAWCGLFLHLWCPAAQPEPLPCPALPFTRVPQYFPAPRTIPFMGTELSGKEPPDWAVAAKRPRPQRTVGKSWGVVKTWVRSSTCLRRAIGVPPWGPPIDRVSLPKTFCSPHRPRGLAGQFPDFHGSFHAFACSSPALSPGPRPGRNGTVGLCNPPHPKHAVPYFLPTSSSTPPDLRAPPGFSLQAVSHSLA